MEKRVCEKTYMKCASIVIPFDFASLLAIDQSKKGDNFAQVPEDTGDLTTDSFIKELFESSAKGGGMVPTFVAMGAGNEGKETPPQTQILNLTSSVLSAIEQTFDGVNITQVDVDPNQLQDFLQDPNTFQVGQSIKLSCDKSYFC